MSHRKYEQGDRHRGGEDKTATGNLDRVVIVRPPIFRGRRFISSFADSGADRFQADFIGAIRDLGLAGEEIHFRGIDSVKFLNAPTDGRDASGASHAFDREMSDYNFRVLRRGGDDFFDFFRVNGRFVIFDFKRLIPFVIGERRHAFRA